MKSNTVQVIQPSLLGSIVFFWRAVLKIGFAKSPPGLAKGRVMLLNGLIIIAAFSVVVFSIVYCAIGYQYFYGPLYILPLATLVVALNHKGKFIAAQNTYLIGSLIIIAYWCYEGRGNGNEYTLIALATTATLICEKRITVIVSNLLCALVFIVYKVYDANTTFVPDPAINYNVVPVIILLNTVGVISFQIAFFRDLARHYDQKLTTKYNELQSTEEELKATNEEVTAMNDKLFLLTQQLENLVKQKTAELQSYINAIDVNLYSCTNDLEGNFVHVNNQLLQASGYSREELLGQHYSLLATPAHQELNFSARREILFAGHTWRGEVEHRSKGGVHYWFDCVVIPIKDENGKTKHFLSIGLPITERKLHEELQNKTYHFLESIVFRASHNIRGPLARINGLANLVQLEMLHVDEFKMVVQRFSECSNELSVATSELVTFVQDHQETLIKRE